VSEQTPEDRLDAMTGWLRQAMMSGGDGNDFETWVVGPGMIGVATQVPDEDADRVYLVRVAEVDSGDFSAIIAAAREPVDVVGSLRAVSPLRAALDAYSEVKAERDAARRVFTHGDHERAMKASLEAAAPHLGSADERVTRLLAEHQIVGPRTGQCRCGYGDEDLPVERLGKPFSLHLTEVLLEAGLLNGDGPDATR
jgi:hypothetical protein